MSASRPATPLCDPLRAAGALACAVTSARCRSSVLQCVSVLGIHTMSLGAPILLEELAALQADEPPAAR